MSKSSQPLTKAALTANILYLQSRLRHHCRRQKLTQVI